MADDAFGFNVWDIRSWKNAHEMPNQFASAKDFEKHHALIEGIELYLGPDPGKKETKFVMKQNLMSENDVTPIRSEEGSFGEGYTAQATGEGKTRTLVLKNPAGEVLAVCVKKASWADTQYKIFAPRPLWDGMEADKDEKLEGASLFEWAVVKHDSASPMDPNAYKMVMSVPSKGVMSTLKRMVNWTAEMNDVPGMSNGTTYVTNDDFKNFHIKTHARVIRKKDAAKSAVAMYVPYKSQTMGGAMGYKVLLAPGIDPCLMMCFLAVSDDLKADRKAAK